jgi:hypothetical protein
LAVAFAAPPACAHRLCHALAEFDDLRAVVHPPILLANTASRRAQMTAVSNC